MAADHEVVLYDLASNKGVCFSPVVWRIRLMLNYKRIPYKTVFLEFPDIEPTLKALGLGSASQKSYTVPAIQHVPTNTYIMESTPIAEFLESTYPNPPLPLTSELGDEIAAKARAVVAKAFATSVMPREILILSPRSQEYFRRTREASHGRRLEDLLDGEEQAWSDMDEKIAPICAMMQQNAAAGPFILGAQPSYTDFFITGSLQCAREVHEEMFHRLFKYPPYRRIYDACLPWMDRKD